MDTGTPDQQLISQAEYSQPPEQVTSQQEEVKALARHVMVDFVQMKTFSEQPFIIESGDGITITDIDGNTYIDGLSGVFVVGTGHRNPAVVQAMHDQLDILAFGPPLHSTNLPALKLAKLIVDITPPQFNTVKFLSGGSESTETAIKMARQYQHQSGHPTKYKVISYYHGYHGGTLGALSATGSSARRWMYEPLAPGFIHVHPPNPYRPPFGLTAEAWEQACVQQFEQVIKAEHPETVAAVIIEPVIMGAGVLIPPVEFLKTLREICDHHHVVLIYDEIITGWGRLGGLFAAEVFGAWPDILCMGKGMSAGYAPLAGVLVADKVAQSFWGEPEEVVEYQGGHTYGGNPLSCAAGLANIQFMLEHKVIENARETGYYLGDRLRKMKGKYRSIGDVRGLGLLWAVEFVRDRESKASYPAEFAFGKRVEAAAKERGLILRAMPHVIILAPPLIVTRIDIDRICDIVDESISVVEKAATA